MEIENIYDLMAKVRAHPHYVYGTVFTRDDVADVFGIEDADVTETMLSQSEVALKSWAERSSFGWAEAITENVDGP